MLRNSDHLQNSRSFFLADQVFYTCVAGSLSVIAFSIMPDLFYRLLTMFNALLTVWGCTMILFSLKSLGQKFLLAALGVGSFVGDWSLAHKSPDLVLKTLGYKISGFILIGYALGRYLSSSRSQPFLLLNNRMQSFSVQPLDSSYNLVERIAYYTSMGIYYLFKATQDIFGQLYTYGLRSYMDFPHLPADLQRVPDSGQFHWRDRSLESERPRVMHNFHNHTGRSSERNRRAQIV